MKIKYLYGLLATLLLQQLTELNAQPLQQKKAFTRQDTLRGSIGPERAWWDVVMYDLTVQPDFTKFTIKGSNTIYFKIVRTPAARLQIDLQEPMILDTAILNGKPMSFTREGNVYWIELPGRKLPPSLPANQYPDAPLQELRLVYHGVPKPALNAPWDGGVVWKKDAQGNPWIGTACQGLGASVWWPCKDHQADEPDSVRINVVTPDTLMNVSNGRFMGVSRSNGIATWSWKVSYPINLYNVTMNVGKYAHFSDTLMGEKGQLDLDYYVMAYNLEKAKEQFKQVKPMLQAFEYWLGPYPFYKDGYKLVESHYLGMEHQSAVAYGNGYRNGYRGRDLSGSGWGLKWDFIIIHETGHEWFGNNISTKDLADMWVHEGFTNYTETLFTDYHYGTAAGNAYAQGIRKLIANDQPIIGTYGVNQEGSGDMYYKGSAMIHMIRQIIGTDNNFRQLLRDMNQQYRHKTVTSAEIENFISTRTGYNLSKMFDQYLRTTQVPTLEYYLSTEKEEVMLNYRWQNCIPGFNMPILLPADTSGKSGLLLATEKWQKFKTGFAPGTLLTPYFDKNFYVNYQQLKQ